MPDITARRTPLERFLGLFTLLRPGEGRSVVLFFLFAFLLLVADYILKTLREPLLLIHDQAEMKSYAYATIAGILLVLIPAYGFIFRRTRKSQLTRWVTTFFIANLGVFYVLGREGIDIGFAYYVWVGIVSLMLTAQFWGYAADTYNLKSGQRLFPVIMVGATLGGLIGPIIAGGLYERIGPWNLMLVVGLLLAATLPLVTAARNAVPAGSKNITSQIAPQPHFMGGLAMVMQDHYLLLLAVLMVILNWVNTTGEYILAEFVVSYAKQRVETDATLVKGEVIATFYSQFYFAVNALTLIIQVLLVARIFRWIGVRGAMLVLPAIAFIGYGLIAFVPVFSIIRVAKIAENSTDYSLMNTTRHTLYLPLSDAHKFEGKTAVETFFWRVGDLIQGGVIFVGLHWLNFVPRDFALMNMLLAAIWFWVAIRLGRMYTGA
ncbi:MAG: NTP/NDP exchange transporter, partial [Pseudomonadales bacterium]